MFRVYYILTYPITAFCLLCIFVYRKVIRYSFHQCCHFLPTCSKYGWDSIVEFGWLLGGILTVKRLLRCTPKHTAGVDFAKLNLLGNYKWKC